MPRIQYIHLIIKTLSVVNTFRSRLKFTNKNIELGKLLLNVITQESLSEFGYVIKSKAED